MKTLSPNTSQKNMLLPISHIAGNRVGTLLRIVTRTVAFLITVLLIIIGALTILVSQPSWPMFLGVLVLTVGIALAWCLSRWFAISLFIIILIGTIGVTTSQLKASTPPIVDSQGKVVPGSIAVMEKVKLGGVNQWIVIRGKSASNPILLFLNGGPGGTQLAWHRQYMSDIEEHFTMVYWEQRGTGKSASLAFSDYGHMTPEQYVADGLELTSYLRQRFGQDKIYLVGQSWGTMLGVWMIQQRPEWFHAYVGIGQMTNPVEDDRLIYKLDLERAQQEGNTELVQSLRAKGPPPYDGFWETTKYGQVFDLANAYQNQLVAASNPPLREPYVGMTDTSEYGIADKIAAVLGGAVTFARVYDQLDDVNLEAQAAKLEVPVYFAEGRYDCNAMPVLAERYFNLLDAPQKQLIWFEHSGHNPEHEEPAAFTDFMVNTVLAQTGAVH